MSPESPNTSSISTGQDGQGKSPADVFGSNEWLVDEIYQQYLQDPNSVDRAWWDFFADYKPGTTAAAPPGSPVPAPQAKPGAAAPVTGGAAAGAPGAPAPQQA
ncbi:2-oxoglutarate dehydrogenase E1 subunit family protein, partial [Streptomyces stramineus]